MMPTAVHLDRDEPLPRPADAAGPPRAEPTDDTGTHDLGELWRDLGGGD
jgi:hypothetical protein